MEQERLAGTPPGMAAQRCFKGQGKACLGKYRHSLTTPKQCTVSKGGDAVHVWSGGGRVDGGQGRVQTLVMVGLVLGCTAATSLAQQASPAVQLVAYTVHAPS